MSGRPPEVEDALVELSKHYDSFEENRRGANGYLFFAVNRVTGAHHAIKFYAGEKGDARHDEPKQLTAIRSRNVLSILDARNVSDEWGYFITPRCFEGDLDDLIVSQPSVHVAVDVALGVCNGVSAIHKLKMLHRDLKPGNIVMHNRDPQIADFGSVRMWDGDNGLVPASQHSVLFRPPESFSTGKYSVLGDLYQIGLVTFQLLGGSLPYDGEDYFRARERTEYDALTNDADRSIFVNQVIRSRAERGRLLDFTSLPPWIDRGARQALRKMTDPDPQRRASDMGDVLAALTGMRATLRDWAWHGEVARLVVDQRVMEVRPLQDGQGTYQAYLARPDGSTFRKAPGNPAGPLQDVIARC